MAAKLKTPMDGYQVVMDGYRRGLRQLATRRPSRIAFYSSIAEDVDNLESDWMNVGNDLLAAARRYGEEESREQREEAICAGTDSPLAQR